MEIIVFILVVVFALLNAKGKKPNANQAGAPQAAQANPKAAMGKGNQLRTAIEREAEALLKATPQAANAAKAVKRQPQAVTRAASVEGLPILMDDDCHGGSMEHVHAEGNSALADEDCAGGSMEHTHTEGVSRTEQASRMAAIDSAERDSDVLPENIDARALRRAVVMAEVLGRPRALRARR